MRARAFWFQSLAIALIMALTSASRAESVLELLLMGYDTYDLPSRSMEPLIPAGSTILADPLRCANAEECELTYGDILVFDVGEDGEQDLWIKSLVGLPGDLVAVHADGAVDVTSATDGVVHRHCQDEGVKGDERDVLLADGELFFLGMNCPRSRDSRSVHIGAVHVSRIVCRALYRLDGFDFVPLHEAP
jgi:signal peptidase I